jgi:putative membrane protein
MTVLPEPQLLLAAAGAAALYVRGWRRHAEAGGGTRRVGELVRFACGLLVLLAALSTWLETAASGSFAWHMVQHQLLVLVAAPLLASARPLRTVRGPGDVQTGGIPADRGGARPGRPASASGPLALGAAAVHLATVLAWHLPPLYDAAMADARLHAVEHLTLLGTALLAWGAVLTVARHREARALLAAVGLAMNALAGAGLGVVLLSAPVPLYGWYADLGAVALDHQRVGGALMKVSAVLVHAGAAVWIVTRWLHRLSAEPDPASVPVVGGRPPVAGAAPGVDRSG